MNGQPVELSKSEAHQAALGNIYSATGVFAMLVSVQCFASIQGRPLDFTKLAGGKPEEIETWVGLQTAFIAAVVLPVVGAVVCSMARHWAKGVSSPRVIDRLPPIFGLALDRDSPPTKLLLSLFFWLSTLLPAAVGTHALVKVFAADKTVFKDGTGGLIHAWEFKRGWFARIEWFSPANELLLIALATIFAIVLWRAHWQVYLKPRRA